jgi:hypothetical protein
MFRFLLLILAAGFVLVAAGLPLCAQDIIRVGIYQNEPLVFTDADGITKGIYPEILDYRLAY